MTGTERKVFQKYYPPDFDPSKLPKAKRSKNRQFVQRVMVPFNLQCNSCNEYVYKGKKFNMRRETVEGESYLGLKIFRFYFHCPNCVADISFKTDLENCDYQQEHGATRLFDAFKYYQEQAKKEDEQEEAEKNDPMKMLEKRTKMSKKEMEAMGELEEIQELNRRHEKIDAREFILDDKKQAFLRAEMERQQREEDEEFVQSIYNKTQNNGKIIKRIEDDDPNEEFPPKNSLLYSTKIKTPGQKELIENLLTSNVNNVTDPGPSSSRSIKSSITSKNSLKGLIVRKRKNDESAIEKKKMNDNSLNVSTTKPPDIQRSLTSSKTDDLSKPPPIKSSTLSSLAAYGSDSD